MHVTSLPCTYYSRSLPCFSPSLTDPGCGPSRSSDPELHKRISEDAPGPFSIISNSSSADRAQTPISPTRMKRWGTGVHVDVLRLASISCHLDIYSTSVQLGEKDLIPGRPSSFSLVVPDPVQGSRTEGVAAEQLVTPPRGCLICHIGVFNYNFTIQRFPIPLASWSLSHLFTSVMYIKPGQRR